MVYLIAVVVGLGIIAWRQTSAVTLVAARDLPINHPVQPGDLSLKPDGQQFLTKEVKANGIVLLADLAPKRVRQPPGPGIPIAVAVEPDDVTARRVMVSSSLRLCDADVPANVRVIDCDEAMTTCVAIVDVLASDRDKLKPDAERILKSSCEASQ